MFFSILLSRRGSELKGINGKTILDDMSKRSNRTKAAGFSPEGQTGCKATSNNAPSKLAVCVSIYICIKAARLKVQ